MLQSQDNVTETGLKEAQSFDLNDERFKKKMKSKLVGKRDLFKI